MLQVKKVGRGKGWWERRKRCVHFLLSHLPFPRTTFLSNSLFLRFWLRKDRRRILKFGQFTLVCFAWLKYIPLRRKLRR
ncbi:unnamed protein product [Ixodes pacificus]